MDCFSGPGGICTGLHAAGFDTRVAIEYIKSCVDTYSANHPNVHVIWSDIRKVQEADVLPYIPKEGIDLVTSGMPCETFSTAGNTSRSFWECARLQSFPDSYDFCGGPYIVPHIDKTVQDKYEQIGDAVPPLLAYAWGWKLQGYWGGCVKMKKKADYKTFCRDVYYETWQQEYLIEMEDKESQSAIYAARLAAQRRAIDKVLVDALLRFAPDVSEGEIWKEIGMIHKLNVAELSDFEIPEEKQAAVIERCLSAHQSWIKTGGHSFERYISNIRNAALQKNEIRFILQSELTAMIKEKRLTNTDKDIAGLKSWGKDFDLYAIQYIHGDAHVFGCIQSKTSIRDRVIKECGYAV